MSQVYNLEPPTAGKIVLHTSFGDIDIELWPREAPLACRNFIQHALDGYYDKTIFHRVIAKFMIQGGDPTGVGDGGEAAYGAPFKDEFHSRLKFNHRGLLAMANANIKNANTSQFFVTLDECDWLTKKHTIFGKVVGQTVFNLLRIGDIDVDANDRPLDPPRLERVSVLDNPFDDIGPRLNRESANGGKLKSEATLRRKKRKKVNDKTLLSFGDDEEVSEIIDKKSSESMKMTSMHDLATTSSHISAIIAPEVREAAVGGDVEYAPSSSKDHANDDFRKPKVLTKKEAAIQLKLALRSTKSLGGNDHGDTNPNARKIKNIIKSSNKDHEEETERKEEDDEDYNQLQRKMKEEQKLRRRKLESNDNIISQDNNDEIDIESVLQNSKKEQAQNEINRKRQEYSEAKSTMRASSAKKTKNFIEHMNKEKADDILTPFQQQRAAFLKRKNDKDLHSRQSETMAALAKFSSKLGQSKNNDKLKKSNLFNNSESEKGEEEEEKKLLKDNEDNSYHGQVTETDTLFGNDADDDNGEWFKGKLKFKKHIDDTFRSGQSSGVFGGGGGNSGGFGGGGGGGNSGGFGSQNMVGGDGRLLSDYVVLDSREVNFDEIDQENVRMKKSKQEEHESRYEKEEHSHRHHHHSSSYHRDRDGRDNRDRDRSRHRSKDDERDHQRHSDSSRDYKSSSGKYQTRKEKNYH